MTTQSQETQRCAFSNVKTLLWPRRELHVESNHVELKNVRQYQHCVRFSGHSCSFHQIVSILTLTSEVTGLSSLRTIHEELVATYASIACSVVLQKLKDVLGVSWAFSVALDTSTVEGTGFMDTGIRACLAGKCCILLVVYDVTWDGIQ
jgi:hypothetical protein